MLLDFFLLSKFNNGDNFPCSDNNLFSSTFYVLKFFMNFFQIVMKSQVLSILRAQYSVAYIIIIISYYDDASCPSCTMHHADA